MGHGHAEHTAVGPSPTITNHTLWRGPKPPSGLPPSLPYIQLSNQSHNVFLDLRFLFCSWPVFCSALFCFVLLGDYLATAVEPMISLKSVMNISLTSTPPLAFPRWWQHQCLLSAVATVTFSVFWPPVHSSPSPVSWVSPESVHSCSQ